MSPAEQREHPRFWVDLPVLLAPSRNGGVELKAGSIFNVSQGGCALASLTNFTVGARLTLFVRNAQGEFLLRVDHAKVCWSSIGEIGLQFQQLGPEERERLLLFLTCRR